MPWLGDGTWVDNPDLARDIVRGRTNYRPWSHDISTATPSKGGIMSAREYTILLARADKATQQRDELLAALKQTAAALEHEVSASDGSDHPVIQEHARIAKLARKVIAKAER